MSLPSASVSTLTVKEAVCPGCGSTRKYYIDGGKPRPLFPGVNRNEILDAATVLDELQATDVTYNQITCTGASWTLDDYVGYKLYLTLTSKGKPIYVGEIESNTDEVITVKSKIKRQYKVVNDPLASNSLFDPSAMPYFYIVDESLMSRDHEVIRSQLMDEYAFVCECNTKYTVEKP